MNMITSKMEEDRDKPWKFHTCKICSYRSKSSFVMYKHESLHQTKSKTNTFTCDSKTLELYNCKICEFDTVLKVNLSEHFRVFHEGKEVNEELENILKCHQCKNCGFDTHSVIVYTKHDTNCDNLNNQENKKSEFSSQTLQSSSNQPPQKRPTENFPFIKHVDRNGVGWFKCTECAFKSKHKYSLKGHRKAKHTNPEDIPWILCKKCPYKCKGKGHLKSHITRRHTKPEDINWFTCTQCPFKSKGKCHLKHHILLKHTKSEDVDWFQCEQCPYKSIRRHDVKKHILIKHTNPEDIDWLTCGQCDFKGRDKSNLRKHFRAKHTVPGEIVWYNCTICGYKSKVKGNVKTHIKGRHKSVS